MRLNIFNKQGMLSEIDRKKPIKHYGMDLIFESSADLSEGVKVTTIGGKNEISQEMYSQNLCLFMVWWMENVWEDLNGFSGFGSIKFDLTNFRIKE